MMRDHAQIEARKLPLEFALHHCGVGQSLRKNAKLSFKRGIGKTATNIDAIEPIRKQRRKNGMRCEFAYHLHTEIIEMGINHSRCFVRRGILPEPFFEIFARPYFKIKVGTHAFNLRILRQVAGRSHGKITLRKVLSIRIRTQEFLKTTGEFFFGIYSAPGFRGVF